MSETAILEEFNIAMNGPDLAQADSIIFKAMIAIGKINIGTFLEQV